MKRMELIANLSVQNEIIGVLEESIPDFYYTLLPQIHGRGKTRYRLGTTTWPELNFMIISYLDDENAGKAQMLIRGIKDRFPKEGIKLFVTEAEMR